MVMVLVLGCVITVINHSADYYPDQSFVLLTFQKAVKGPKVVKDILFTINDKRKEQILSSEKWQQENIWHICLRSFYCIIK